MSLNYVSLRVKPLTQGTYGESFPAISKERNALIIPMRPSWGNLENVYKLRTNGYKVVKRKYIAT